MFPVTRQPEPEMEVTKRLEAPTLLIPEGVSRHLVAELGKLQGQIVNLINNHEVS